MKRAPLQKPVLNTAQALQFAAGAASSTPAAPRRPRTRKPAQEGAKPASRVFFAPEGDKRLTINLRQDIHKKLRMLAVEKETTIGEIIEDLVERHLK